MKRCGFAMSAIVALGVSSVSAEEPAPIKLTLTPAKPPTPALRYQLLPDVRITISGDAAPLYRKAIELLAGKQPYTRQVSQLFDKWDVLPLNKLPTNTMRKVLGEYDELYALLDQAARCDRCGWHWLDGVREQKMELFYAELQATRQFAQLLFWRTRLEMAEGRFDKSLITLRNWTALARHVGESDTLISFLVGVALAAMMEAQLDRFIEQPGAPNLYYALTDLPAPLFGMHRALRGERVVIYYYLFPQCPNLALNLDGGSMTASQLEASAQLVRDDFRSKRLSDLTRLQLSGNAALAELLRPAPSALAYLDLVHLSRHIQDKHETAKQALIAAGRPRDKVEVMPPVQVALLHSMLEYDATIDELTVWQQLPFWELTDRLDALMKRDQEERPNDPRSPALSLTKMFLTSGFKKVAWAGVRMNRKVALLRTIEALRFYAATHEDRLPPNLAAVKEVPLPLDPVTGKAFEYALSGDVAKLRGPAPTSEPPTIVNSVVYELRIRR